MANEFYDHTTYPSQGAAGSSSALRAELDSIEVGFDKLPTMASNGSKIVAVNSGGTALEAITTTGTGSGVRATSPTLVTPNLGTPSALVGTNITGTAAGLTAGNVTTNANLTGPITSTGNATAVAAQTGTGSTFVMQESPTLTTPNIGTPSAGVATNLTGTAAGLTAGLATDTVSKTGTGSTYATSVSPSFTTPALGTPSAAVLTNASGLPLTTGVTGTLPVANGGTGVATTTAYSPVLTGTTSTGALKADLGPGTAGQVLTSGGAGAYPTWATPASGAPDSAIQVNTSNGYGSSSTTIRRFTNTAKQRGSHATDFTVSHSATLGTTITINTADYYTFSYSESVSSGQYFGLSIDATAPELTTQFLNIAQANRLCGGACDNTQGGGHCGGRFYIPAGSVIRPHTNAVAGGTAAFCQLDITRG